MMYMHIHHVHQYEYKVYDRSMQIMCACGCNLKENLFPALFVDEVKPLVFHTVSRQEQQSFIVIAGSDTVLFICR